MTWIIGGLILIAVVSIVALIATWPIVLLVGLLLCIIYGLGRLGENVLDELR